VMRGGLGPCLQGLCKTRSISATTYTPAAPVSQAALSGPSALVSKAHLGLECRMARRES
jgi:hypothetical protein